MIDLATLQPDDEIRHQRYTDYVARVITLNPRIEVILLSPPEQAGDHASLDRGDVETRWERNPGATR